MRTLDDIDKEILRLLAEDARRPYSEIAEAVDRSPPTVSDRIDRLRDLGVIRRFTVDVDRSTLDAGTPVLLELSVRPGSLEAVRDALADAAAVEHVFATAGARVVAQAHVSRGDPREFLAETVSFEDVTEYDVSLVTDAEWRPQVPDVELALSCAECGNTVTPEGETATLGDTRYHFCCPSCQDRFAETYDRLQEEA